jgi:hypothetical protein
MSWHVLLYPLLDGNLVRVCSFVRYDLNRAQALKASVDARQIPQTQADAKLPARKAHTQLVAGLKFASNMDPHMAIKNLVSQGKLTEGTDLQTVAAAQAT